MPELANSPKPPTAVEQEQKQAELPVLPTKFNREAVVAALNAEEQQKVITPPTITPVPAEDMLRAINPTPGG